jgi:hypothetical protein
VTFLVEKVDAVPVIRTELLVNNVRMCPAKKFIYKLFNPPRAQAMIFT